MTDGRPNLDWMRFADVAVYVVLVAFAITRWRNLPHNWIGGALSLPAFYLWMLARHQLGASFAVRAEARGLVTHGLYSKIRNPIYLFGGLAFLGVFVALGWYLWVAIFAVMNVGQYMRSKREEQVLTEAFGDEYLAYRARTWF